jgi:hypothetical protein
MPHARAMEGPGLGSLRIEWPRQAPGSTAAIADAETRAGLPCVPGSTRIAAPLRASRSWTSWSPFPMMRRGAAYETEGACASLILLENRVTWPSHPTTR